VQGFVPDAQHGTHAAVADLALVAVALACWGLGLEPL
jgi:hypothetical protein